MAPLGTGYGLFAGVKAASSIVAIPAVFSEPLSLAYDGSHLWLVDKNLTYLQKINISGTFPFVEAQVELSGMGVTQIREVKYDSGSGYLFVSCLDSRIVAIINPTTNTVVGFMDHFADGWQPSARTRSCTFDGSGNVWTLDRVTGGPSKFRRYSIAGVVSSYPATGNYDLSTEVTWHVEEIDFGGGYVWGGGSANSFFSPGGFTAGDSYDLTLYGGPLLRLDPSTGTVVAHLTGNVGGMPIPPFFVDNGYQTWGGIYAHGSFWTSDDISTVLRWDPAQFEPRNAATPVVCTPHINPLVSGAFSGRPSADTTSVWFGSSGIADHRVHRMDEATNTRSSIELGSTFGCTGSAYDGSQVWFTRRYSGSPAIFRVNGDVAGEEHIDLQFKATTNYILKVTPAKGPATGGTNVTIKGIGFSTATGVTFDSISATNFAIVDDNTITCTTPNVGASFAYVLVSRSDGDLEFYSGFRFI